MEPGGYRLSWTERMRIAAAVYLMGKFNRAGIILSGGEVYQGNPPLSQVAKETLVRRYHVASKKITTVGGQNTVQEFDHIVGRVKEDNLLPSQVLVISNDFHLIARYLAWINNMGFISPEEILPEIDTRYRRITQDLKESKTYRDQRVLQMIGVLMIATPFVGKYMYAAVDNKMKSTAAPVTFDPYYLRKL
jgi:hypothetical protein